MKQPPKGPNRGRRPERGALRGRSQEAQVNTLGASSHVTALSMPEMWLQDMRPHLCWPLTFPGNAHGSSNLFTNPHVCHVIVRAVTVPANWLRPHLCDTERLQTSSFASLPDLSCSVWVSLWVSCLLVFDGYFVVAVFILVFLFGNTFCLFWFLLIYLVTCGYFFLFRVGVIFMIIVFVFKAFSLVSSSHDRPDHWSSINTDERCEEAVHSLFQAEDELTGWSR